MISSRHFRTKPNKSLQATSVPLVPELKRSVKMKIPITPQNKPDPSCAPSELKRFKTAGWIVLALSTPVPAMAIFFGNAPRSLINQMNLFLAPLVVAALCVATYTLKRFRRACLAWYEKKQLATSD